MQTRNPFFDHVAQAMTEAAGAADGVRREAETVFRGQLQKMLADMDLVTREEFDAVQEMAAKTRAENEELKERLEALEGKAGA
ncbi:MAG: accessory factor UbiK family protein [Pseudomonadota bacterium]